ncbi:hypothetical protein AGRA3207_005278 [Actinomadura graeca]|uniref:Lipoprotein n=1 Tax=Actinomadura graeca TaxID=2750812 RepID=A0ABX8QYY8_9ACTN|nr:hypothetical protein [Actinomadura graeca]QXJ24031.1 hypothetical protein AGRA3207_005278 [Actinomadura graeca]
MIRNSRRVAALAVAGTVAIAPVISGCGAGSEPQTAAPTQLTEGVNVTVPTDRPEAAEIDIRNMFLLGPKADMVFGQGSSLPLYATVINQVQGRPDKLVSVASPAFSQARITGGSVALPPAQPSGQGSAVQLVGQAAPPSASPGASKTPKPDKNKKKTQEPGATGEPTPGASTEPGGGGSPAEPGASSRPSGTPETPAPTGAGETPNPGTSATSSNTPSPPATEPSLPVPPGGKAPLVVLTGLNRQLLGGERVTLRLRFEQAGSVDVSVPVIPQQGEYTSYTAVSAGSPAPGVTPGQPSEGAPHGASPGTSPGAHEGTEPAPPGSGAPATGATPGEGAEPSAPASPEGGTGH